MMLLLIAHSIMELHTSTYESCSYHLNYIHYVTCSVQHTPQIDMYNTLCNILQTYNTYSHVISDLTAQRIACMITCFSAPGYVTIDILCSM